MNKVKVFYNRNFKFLMLLFSINPIVNVILDNKKKGVLQSFFSQFSIILTIVISLILIYHYNNLERVKRINTEKTSFVVFAIFSLICSIFRYTFIETVIISLEGTLVFFVLMNVFINRVENRINRIKIAENKYIDKKEKEELYDSRKPSKDRILNILKEEAKSLILVDGEWGIGKTFFMDRVLGDEKSILAVKVDVLLFNEKKQMINFVMEEINKILLEKGIRSTSIRKYLSVINDGIDNKFIKGLYKAFSNEKTDDIEKNIKEDIEALKDEKLVIIVDNLERTLDKKITIDILGFLHYIYEKLGVFVVVLADSSKLRDEISREIPSAEDYLKKFFIDKIKLPSVDYREIINNLENFHLFLRNTDIQENIIYEYQKNEKKLLSSINQNKMSIGINETKKELEEEKKKEMNELENNRNKLEMYNFDYFKILRVFENPRSYQSILNLYEDCKERIVDIYHFDRPEIYENLLLRVAFYIEIYGNEKFNKDTLEDEKPLTYKLLFNTVKNDLEKNIVNTLINFSNDEILEAIKIIENGNSQVLDIRKALEYFQIYYNVLKNYKDKIDNLYQFYIVNKDKFFEFLNNPGNMKYLFNNNLKYEGLVYIDRIYFVEKEESIIDNLYKKNQFLKFRKNENESSINGAVLENTVSLLLKVEERKNTDFNDEFKHGFNDLMRGFSEKDNNWDEIDIIRVSTALKVKIENSELLTFKKNILCTFYTVLIIILVDDQTI